MDFNALFANLPESIVVVSPAYKILAATDYYLEITMRTREQLLGLHFLKEAFPEKDLPYEENPVKKALDEVLRTKKTITLDVIRYDLEKPEAEGGGYDVRYWETSHIPVLDETGEVAYIFQKATDVTERELAKSALYESEERFRFMAEAMPQLVSTRNLNTEITFLNSRWASYTGRPVSELLAGGWEKLLHPDDVTPLTSRWAEARYNLEPFQIEFRIQNADGQYRWHLGRSLPMKDEHNNVLMWVSSYTDVHDMRQMVQELVATNEQAARLADQVQMAYTKAETERKTLERLIMQAPAMFCMLDGPEHIFKLVNDRYQQVFPHRDLVGKRVAHVLPEVIEQGFVDILDGVYTTGKEFKAEEVLIKLDRKNTGELEDSYLTFLYQPIYTDNKITGILAFAYEVTEEVKYKQKLQELGYVQ